MDLNLESKKQYLESYQKNMTKYCMNQCFNSKVLGVNKECIDTCVDKYVRTSSVIYSTIDDYLVENGSVYGFKLMDSNHISTGIVYNQSYLEYKYRELPWLQVKDKMSNKYK